MSANLVFPWNLSDERLAELAAQIDLVPIFEAVSAALQVREAAFFLPTTHQSAEGTTAEAAVKELPASAR